MHSLHLLHTYERLAANVNLGNANLLFNPDGTVNSDEAYSLLSEYGISKQELVASISNRDTDTLVSKAGVSIAPIVKFIVENLSINIIDGKLDSSNRLLVPTSGWNGDNPPTNMEYLDYANSTWRPFPEGGLTEAKYGIQHSPTKPQNINIMSCAGITCQYNRLSMLCLSSIPGINGTPYIIITLDQYGNIVNIVKPFSNMLIPEQYGTLVRYGNTLYSAGWPFTSPYNLYTCKYPTEDFVYDNFSVDPNFVCPDLGNLTLGGPIQLSLQNTTLYIGHPVLDSSNVGFVYGYSYDLGTYEVSDPIIVPDVGNKCNAPMYYFSKERALFVNYSDKAITCMDLVEQEILWSTHIPAPTTFDCGFHYDAIHDRIYLLGYDGSMVRLTCV